ncbi:carboxylesterase family protein [Amycolatopsis carbonis]|uniref:Carboxylesterase family protein n=1 Tax=Amycolatopsis carbonis TaxID=715471 RepID=A0A9Y2IE10_9PSEU|nr:carboxylesterase family protein [Amycolatopsis sp. 2-15]WIX77286.1 carboxylesterase family protein [Amycolatopsis sp. 2-15]
MNVPEIRAEAGRVRGRTEGRPGRVPRHPVRAAAGGELRSAAPQPVPAWDGVREALAFGSSPPQSLLLGPPSNAVAGDDWLTLDVWSPRPGAGAAVPVMVWIHGGAFQFGHAADPTYDGARLAREAGVVLVTFNYRVGVEGLGHLRGARDNRGMLDRLAALEWMRANIAAGHRPKWIGFFARRRPPTS